MTTGQANQLASTNTLAVVPSPHSATPGDLQMLQWTAAGSGPRFCLYVHHTDEKREWAYDRTSHIGKLDKGLDEAKARGWTVVDMKNEWKVIYPIATK